MDQYEKVGRYALFTSFVCMVVAMTFVLLDIGRMERFWHSLAFWNIISILAWEIRFYMIYIALLLAEMYFATRRDLIKRANTHPGWIGRLSKWLTLGSTDLSESSIKRDQRWMKILGILGIPIAIIGVHGGTGTLFAVVVAQPYWNSPLFPLVFVLSALVSGTALLMALYVVERKARGLDVDLNMLRGLAHLMIFFLVIDMLFQFYEFLIAGYGLAPDQIHTLSVMMSGPFSWTFWIVQVGLGMVVPIGLVAYPKTARSVWGLTIAAIAVVIGIIGVRFNIVVPTQIVHQLPGMPEGYYIPNLVEWLASVGIVAMGLILYSFGVRWLPLEIQEKEGVEHVT